MRLGTLKKRVMQKVPSFERSEKVDCVLECVDESVNVVFSVVEMKASSCACTDSQMPMERLSTVVT